MITLNPITHKDLEKLDGLSYANMSSSKKTEMINASEKENYNGKFFKFLLIEADGKTVGCINILGHSKSVVSIAPEIKVNFREKGYAKQAKLKAIEYVKLLGYKIEYAGIKADNFASIRLHESLGFEYVQDFFSINGNELKLYIKIL